MCFWLQELLWLPPAQQRGSNNNPSLSDSPHHNTPQFIHNIPKAYLHYLFVAKHTSFYLLFVDIPVQHSPNHSNHLSPIDGHIHFIESLDYVMALTSRPSLFIPSHFGHLKVEKEIHKTNRLTTLLLSIRYILKCIVRKCPEPQQQNHRKQCR